MGTRKIYKRYLHIQYIEIALPWKIFPGTSSTDVKLHNFVKILIKYITSIIFPYNFRVLLDNGYHIKLGDFAIGYTAEVSNDDEAMLYQAPEINGNWINQRVFVSSFLFLYVRILITIILNSG